LKVAEELELPAGSSKQRAAMAAEGAIWDRCFDASDRHHPVDRDLKRSLRRKLAR
jgi:hypothetical protein